MISDLCDVVGSWRCCTRQPVGSGSEHFNQLGFSASIYRFEDATIVNKHPIYAKRGMLCCSNVIEIDMSIGIPESFQVRMSQFQNLKTVHPREANFASFLVSCALRLRCECPSTSIAILRLGLAMSIL